jgi:hypothetical protein
MPMTVPDHARLPEAGSSRDDSAVPTRWFSFIENANLIFVEQRDAVAKRFQVIKERGVIELKDACERRRSHIPGEIRRDAVARDDGPAIPKQADSIRSSIPTTNSTMMSSRLE